MVITDYKDEIVADFKRQFPHLAIQDWHKKTEQQIDGKTEEEIEKLMMLNALEKVTAEEPDWTYVAANVLLHQLYRQAQITRDESEPYGSLLGLIQLLTKEGIYSENLLNTYSNADIDSLQQAITPERDRQFTYIGLKTLSDRYLARMYDGCPAELPQERFMIIAMTLMAEESEDTRLERVQEAYWALSNLYMTVATPTLANAGKSYGQLSSCFIDTVDDSLRGIFDSNTDVATLSKSGGGIGVYLGKIRSRGSDIKGFSGVSSGVLPWMKQLNNTAVSVDQLGQRQGAIAVYLDIWHRDIFSFLDAKLNNGDERYRTHDLFTAVCLPDLFMEKVDARENWYLFDPHEVKKIMGFALEDFYDENQGVGSFRERYQACVEHPDLSKQEVPAIELFKRIMISQLETGSPFMFYRDAANRANANRHEGMIYGSNLCTEIMQNMSATRVIEETIENGKIIVTKEPGDFVVCNLSSISLAKAVQDDVLERLIPIQVRMLDNVIDRNDIEVKQAKKANQKYRAVGLGTFGWHHLLALKRIRWESDEAVQYVDKLYEKIAYLTIKASNGLAKEKGAYPAFKGSDWESGDYFAQKDYDSADWLELQEAVKNDGIRNGYLMAVAPNSSTSLIAGSTASIDPIFQKAYAEEKKNYKIPVTAPDLNETTTWYYKSGYHIDQHWSIKQNEKRQRHIDQAISFNLYVKNSIKAKELLQLHMDAWRSGMKTTYYVRSTSTEIEDCDSCES